LNELIRHASKTWHGVNIGQPDWGEHSHAFAFEARLYQAGPSIYLILNAYWEALEFELPPVCGTGCWRRWIDTSLEPPQEINPWESAVPLSGLTYHAAARSVVVLFEGSGELHVDPQPLHSRR
jgi:glycogen operon protein